MWLLPPRRAARPPPRCLVWHRGIGPGGNGARRGSDAPGHWPHHGLVLLEGSEEGVSSSMGSSSNPPPPGTVTSPTASWGPTVGGELGTCQGESA